MATLGVFGVFYVHVLEGTAEGRTLSGLSDIPTADPADFLALWAAHRVRHSHGLPPRAERYLEGISRLSSDRLVRAVLAQVPLVITPPTPAPADHAHTYPHARFAFRIGFTLAAPRDFSPDRLRIFAVPRLPAILGALLDPDGGAQAADIVPSPSYDYSIETALVASCLDVQAPPPLAAGAPATTSTLPRARTRPPLAPHQLRGVEWMASREKSVVSMFVRDGLVHPCLNLDGDIVYVWPGLSVLSYCEPIMWRGGWLAFSPGTGKTRTALALIDLYPLRDGGPARARALETWSTPPPPPPAPPTPPAPPAAVPSTSPSTSTSTSTKRPRDSDIANGPRPVDRDAAGRPIVGTTLIVCGPTTLGQWEAEANLFFPRSRILRYYNIGRERRASAALDPASEFAGLDVIITTYASLAADAGRSGPLLRVNFWRAVFDEGHCLSNPRTGLHAALSGVAANSKWILTATPIYRGPGAVGDLQGQLNALVGTRDWCPGSNVGMCAVFREESPPDRCTPFVHALLSRSMLTFRKDEPPPTLRVLDVVLSGPERAAYSALESASRETLSLAPPRSGIHMRLLRLLTLMRHACSAGHIDVPTAQQALVDLRAYLASSSSSSSFSSSSSSFSSVSSPAISSVVASLPAFNLGDAECVVCMDEPDPQDMAQTVCRHLICKACIAQILAMRGPRCPVCRQALGGAGTVMEPHAVENVDADELVPPAPSPSPPGPDPSSSSLSSSPPPLVAQMSKVDLLVRELEAKVDDGGKAVVYSQFPATLRLVGEALRARGMAFATVEGSMSATRRKSILNQYMEDPLCSVLLLGTRVAAVGINVHTVANRFYLMDPCLNLGLELQAIHRGSRLGQKRHVTITWLIVENSVEVRIMARRHNLSRARSSFETSATPIDRVPRAPPSEFYGGSDELAYFFG